MQFVCPEIRNMTNAPAAKTFLASLAPVTAAALGTVTLQPSGALISDIVIRVDVAGAETVAITATTFGGDTVTAATLPLINLATGNPILATLLVTGNYAIPCDRGGSTFQSLIFTKSAAIQIGSASVAVAYDVQGCL
jgi:hypothetical protein